MANRLTICVSAEYEDGTSDLNATTLVQDDMHFDGKNLAASFAAMLEQHIGDPVLFLAKVLLCLERGLNESVPGWRQRMYDAAQQAH